MSQLNVEGISKMFKEKVALHRTSFQVEPGSCIVLCGGNGAGKSTMINILAGISVPNEGNVYLGDANPTLKRKEYLHQIGFMPDDYRAQDTLAVKEFLLFYASIRRIKKDRVEEVLEMIGLKDKRALQVKSLSKGMKQRLLFGQALLGNPKLLIMDEPTNGLDPYWVDQFLAILFELKKNGTIIIFSTHMMDVAAEIGSEILFMKEGKVIETLNSQQSVKENITRLMELHRL
jgi:ABC-2 type transport system ATP-binding protein